MYGKITNVPNHHPDLYSFIRSKRLQRCGKHLPKDPRSIFQKTPGSRRKKLGPWGSLGCAAQPAEDGLDAGPAMGMSKAISSEVHEDSTGIHWDLMDV